MTEPITTMEFKVRGMTCAGCVMSVEYALHQIKGVQSVTVDYLSGGQTRIEFESDQVAPEQIAKALHDAGYVADFSISRNDDGQEVVMSKSKQRASKRWLTLFLLALMLTGAGTVAYVFSSHQEALPIGLGEVAVDGTGASMVLPIVPLEEYEFTENSLDWFASDIAPANAVSPAFGERTVQIPDPDSEVTILLAGLAGCATCGIEAQTLAQLQNEYGTDSIQTIFVDIYNYGGPENLAWFANMLEATNLIWTIDADGSFKQGYQVDIDSTVIMNRSGEILYRDNVVTPYETLKEQIEMALVQS